MTRRKANALIGALCWLVLGAGVMWISYADAAGSVRRVLRAPVRTLTDRLP